MRRKRRWQVHVDTQAVHGRKRPHIRVLHKDAFNRGCGRAVSNIYSSCSEAERTYGSANLIGRCDICIRDVYTNVFNTLGAEYITAAKPGGYIIMDELGFMEKDAEKFKRAVFNALDGNIPIIAALKARYDVDFLNRIRAHEKSQLYTITPENRDALYAGLLGIITR